MWVRSEDGALYNLDFVWKITAEGRADGGAETIVYFGNVGAFRLVTYSDMHEALMALRMIWDQVSSEARGVQNWVPRRREKSRGEEAIAPEDR